MSGSAGPLAQGALPSWAVVTPKRLAHIERVVDVLSTWSNALALTPHERGRWLRAGWLHDAMRDAPESELRRWSGDQKRSTYLLHGLAAAACAAADGEVDPEVLDAARWHTVGWAAWGRPGRALYCADFLEPGRDFDVDVRNELALRYPTEPDAVLREVLRRRTAYAVTKGWALEPETVAFRAAVNA